MVEPRAREQIDDAAAGARLGVVRAEDEAAQPRVHDRPGAHDAGLEGDIEIAIGQPVVAQRGGGVAQRRDLRVRGRIAGGDRGVAALADDPAVADKDRAYRDFAAALRRARELDRLAHPALGSGNVQGLVGRGDFAAHVHARVPPPGEGSSPTTASASISTSISESISRETSTIAHAGRMSRNASPWALPIASQWPMSVT